MNFLNQWLGAARRSAVRFAGTIAEIPVESLILVLGFIYSGFLRVATFELDYDHTIMIATAVNFREGGSLGILAAVPGNLSALTDNRLAHWPPGYALVIVALLFAGASQYIAAITSDIVSLGLFLGACLFVLGRLRNTLPKISRVAIAVIVGIVGPPYLEFFANTWTLALFLWATALLLPDSNGQEPSPTACALAGVLCGLTVLFRYAYGPASLMPVVAMVIAGWRTREGRIRAAAVAAGWLIGAAPFLYWKFVYVKNVQVGPLQIKGEIWLENLLRFHPFAGDSLTGRRLSWAAPFSEYKFKRYVDAAQFTARHVFSSIVLLIATIGVRQALGTPEMSAAKRIAGRFFLIGALAIAGNLIFLVVLSVLHPPDPNLWGWVYVEEPRYFAVSHPFILAGAAAALAGVQLPGWRQLTGGIAAAVFFFSFVLWGLSVPHELKKLKKSRFGGPLDRYFVDEGAFYRMITAVDDPRGTLVTVEVGRVIHATWARRHASTIARIPSIELRRKQDLATKKAVDVLIFSDRSLGPDVKELLDWSCGEIGAAPFEMGSYRLCRGVLHPPA